MWPLKEREREREKLHLNRSSSSSSTNNTPSLTSSASFSSSSSSSSPSPSPLSHQHHLSNQRPSEDVWKDISLSSLNNVNVNVNNSSFKKKNLNATTFSPVIFQDFFVKESSMKVGSSTRCVPPTPSPTSTFLSLTPAAPYFHGLFGNSSEKFKEKTPLLQSQSLSDSGFRGCSGNGNVTEKKRELDHPSYDSVDDHRHKRMIKNRESACRSRARKQAYTNELELEVDNLRKEIGSLKEQLNRCHLVAAEQHSKRYPSHKTLATKFKEAPF